jgi:hypothetical protein
MDESPREKFLEEESFEGEATQAENNLCRNNPDPRRHPRSRTDIEQLSFHRQEKNRLVEDDDL